MTAVLLLNGLIGIMGNAPAVQFQYTEHEIQQIWVVPFNTVNMAKAISPIEPAKQLQHMEHNQLPLKLWVGQDDELFNPQKVQVLYPATEIVPEATHLGILVTASKLMGPWIDSIVSGTVRSDDDV